MSRLYINGDTKNMEGKIKRLKKEKKDLEDFESRVLDMIASGELPQEELKETIQDLFVISEVIMKATAIIKEAKRRKK